MLGLISQWVPCYLASDITQNSISQQYMASHSQYYLFQQSEAQFMKCTSITREDPKLKHDGITPTHDEAL